MFVLLLTTASSREAVAHGGLKGSFPAAGSKITTPLTEIRLDFTEAPELAFTSVEIRGPSGAVVQTGVPSVAGTSVHFRLKAELPSGLYRVTWKTAGRDGHPITGVFTFSMLVADTLPPSTNAPLTPMAPMEMHHDSVSMPTGRGFDAESPVYVVTRWLQFAALLTLIGAFAFWHVVLRLFGRKNPKSELTSRASSPARRLGIIAATALLALGVARLIAQSYAMHGIDQPVGATMLPMLTQTTWGVGWLLQLVGCVVAIAGLVAARRNAQLGWNVAALGGLFAAMSPALSGHAASSPELTGLAITADSLHVVGAAGWLGSLLFVLVVGIPVALGVDDDQKHSAIAGLVNAFSPTALLFAGLTALTGVFAAWQHIGSLSAIFGTAYGRTLLLKLGILSIVGGTGAYNWLRVRPTLGAPDATARLKRSATIEVLVAIMVLAVTAVLVATPTAMDEKLMQPSAVSQAR